MKNQLLKLSKVLLLIPCLLFLVNCSKSSKDKNTNNAQCYQNQYGQPQGQYGYGYNQGSTYYNPNCNTGQYGNGGYVNGGSTQQCLGTYWYQGQPVLCQHPQQCSGYTLQMNQGGQNSQPTTPGAAVRCM